MPELSDFKEEKEYVFFRAFIDFSHDKVSSHFGLPLWSRLVFQAIQQDRAIWDTVMTIGASNVNSFLSPLNEVGTLRHQFAFRQYTTAVCSLQRDVAGIKYEVRTTLTACLLWRCFESFHTCHDRDAERVYAGLRRFRDWTFSHYSLALPNRLKTGVPLTENPSTEDDIACAFDSLEMQTLLYADSLNMEAHRLAERQDVRVFRTAPEVFASLLEARTALENIIRRSMHGLASSMHTSTFPPSALSSTLKVHTNPDTNTYTNILSTPLFYDIDTEGSEQYRRRCEYISWDEAFKPLTRNPNLDPHPYSQRKVSPQSLNLLALASFILISCNNCALTLTHSGRFARELADITNLAHVVLDDLLAAAPDRSAAPPLDAHSYDLYMLIPLMSIAWLYRHRVLRRVAIELLLRSPRAHNLPSRNLNMSSTPAPQPAEALWDGKLVGNIMAWLNHIEEECCGLASVPVSSSAHAPSGPVAPNFGAPRSTSISGNLSIFSISDNTPLSGIRNGSVSGNTEISDKNANKTNNSGNDKAQNAIGVDFLPAWAAAKSISMAYDEELCGARVSCCVPVRDLASGVLESVRRETSVSW